jgi:hypothetical protein
MLALFCLFLCFSDVLCERSSVGWLGWAVLTITYIVLRACLTARNIYMYFSRHTLSRLAKYHVSAKYEYVVQECHSGPIRYRFVTTGDQPVRTSLLATVRLDDRRRRAPDISEGLPGDVVAVDPGLTSLCAGA